MNVISAAELTVSQISESAFIGTMAAVVLVIAIAGILYLIDWAFKKDAENRKYKKYFKKNKIKNLDELDEN